VPGWGIEQDAGRVLAARKGGVDVRLSPPGALAAVTPGSVGAVVLGPVVDILTVSDLDTLVRSAGAVLAANGTLAAATFEPSTFAQAQPVLHDLAPGRPLQLATWAYLLGLAGFGPMDASAVEVDHGHVRILTVRAGAA
jgi:hypothetical protein